MRQLCSFGFLVLVVAGCSGADNPLLGSGDGSVQDTSNAVDTGTTADSGGMTIDAGKDVVVDPPKDSGPPTSSIACGNSKCTSPNETCCRTGIPQLYSYACTMQNGCAGLSIVCDKRQNCESMGKPGTVCCGHYMINGQTAVVNQVDCTQPANCTQQNNAVVLCDPNDASQCLQGETCTLSQTTIPGYYFCK